jgi:tetratricopeptide (TPR) repeat protein
VAYEEGHDAEARDHLLAALAARDAHGGTHRMLGLVYDRLGDRSAALRHYERAAALDPEIASQAHIKRRLTELRDNEAGEPPPAPDRAGGK